MIDTIKRDDQVCDILIHHVQLGTPLDSTQFEDQLLDLLLETT